MPRAEGHYPGGRWQAPITRGAEGGTPAATDPAKPTSSAKKTNAKRNVEEKPIASSSAKEPENSEHPAAGERAGSSSAAEIEEVENEFGENEIFIEEVGEEIPEAAEPEEWIGTSYANESNPPPRQWGERFRDPDYEFACHRGIQY